MYMIWPLSSTALIQVFWGVLESEATKNTLRSIKKYKILVLEKPVIKVP